MSMGEKRDGPLGSKKVLIIGAGIAGLTAAIALRQRNFNVELIERDPTWSVYGVGIIQQANVVRAVAALGILEDYLHAGFGFDRVRMFAPDGTQIATIPLPRLGGTNYPGGLGISRPALHKVLGDGAISRGATIRLGVTATALEQNAGSVGVEFSDGSTGDYAVVIGADGLYSRTRDQIFPGGPVPAFTGQAVWRYNFPREPDVDTLIVYEGRTGVGLVPLSNELMYMYVTTVEPGNPRLPRAGMAAALRARLADAPPRIATLVPAITDDAGVVYKPLETLFIDGPWHHGRILLIGDAVHATTPHFGQGAGMAIEDSLVLAEELAKTPNEPEAAFEAFRARRFERCRIICENSVAVGEYQLGLIDSLDYTALNRKIVEITSAPL